MGVGGVSGYARASVSFPGIRPREHGRGCARDAGKSSSAAGPPDRRTAGDVLLCGDRDFRLGGARATIQAKGA